MSNHMRNPCDDGWMSPCIVQETKYLKEFQLLQILVDLKHLGGHLSKLKHAVIREPY